MMKDLLKRFPFGTSFMGLVLLVLGVGFAAMFSDEGIDLDLPSRDTPDTTQPMDLGGEWLGMRLSAANGTAGENWGIVSANGGVLITEISERAGWRARQGGLQAGDVLLAVNETKIKDVNALYDLTRSVNVTEAVVLDVQRFGQAVRLMLPALYVGVPMPPQGMPMNAMAPQAMAPQAMVAAQPVAWGQPAMAQQWQQGAQPAWGAAQQGGWLPTVPCPQGNPWAMGAGVMRGGGGRGMGQGWNGAQPLAAPRPTDEWLRRYYQQVQQMQQAQQAQQMQQMQQAQQMQQMQQMQQAQQMQQMQPNAYAMPAATWAQ